MYYAKLIYYEVAILFYLNKYSIFLTFRNIKYDLQEMNAVQNNNSKVNASKNTTEIRLNRTIEELEKAKMIIVNLKSKQTVSIVLNLKIMFTDE